jgi:hypothetical protein
MKQNYPNGRFESENVEQNNNKRENHNNENEKRHEGFPTLAGDSRGGWVTIPACIAVRHILLHIIDFSAVHVIVR